jgi:hypothetical protein
MAEVALNEALKTDSDTRLPPKDKEEMPHSSPSTAAPTRSSDPQATEVGCPLVFFVKEESFVF